MWQRMLHKLLPIRHAQRDAIQLEPESFDMISRTVLQSALLTTFNVPVH
jgi:hypothetical protein